jgi:hypothetical protein
MNNFRCEQLAMELVQQQLSYETDSEKEFLISISEKAYTQHLKIEKNNN